MKDDRQVLAELQCAVDRVLTGVSTTALQVSVARLSEEYRGLKQKMHSHQPFDEKSALAYVATRMPATLAATQAVVQELRNRVPSTKLKTLLDIGSGPGTALWATLSEFPELTRARLVEPNSIMARMGRKLLSGISFAESLEVYWHEQTDDLPVTEDLYDLVVVGYVLTELTSNDRRLLVKKAWDYCGDALIVIVPGSMEGYRVMLEARAYLKELRARLVAPCPHTDACPLPTNDWCHFGVRLNRSSIHRRLKVGSLPYEDEKYTYLVATREKVEPVTTRVIDRPRKDKQRVSLKLCGEQGVWRETVTRSQKDRYRLARKSEWGSSWD